MKAIIALLLTGLALDARAGFSYLTFDSADGLLLRAHAAAFEGRLRLTPSIGGKGLGGAWHRGKQHVRDGFETTFQIQVTEKVRFGADGLAFVIHNTAGEPGLGWPGCNMGFGGLTNLFVIKFDTYHWLNDRPVAPLALN